MSDIPVRKLHSIGKKSQMVAILCFEPIQLIYWCHYHYQCLQAFVWGWGLMK